MKKSFFILITSVLLGAYSTSGQFIHWDGSSETRRHDPNTELSWLAFDTTGQWTLDYLNSQFGSGGELEGYRFATIDESWSYFRYMGYNSSGSDSEKGVALRNILESFGDTFSFKYHPPFGEPWTFYSNWGFTYSDSELWNFDLGYEEYQDSGNITGNIDLWKHDGFPYGTHWLIVGATSPVPEPAEIGLFALPLGLGLFLYIRRKRRNLGPFHYLP